jgi:peptidoglycan biosynthesis protein MviN/MurJ (putative lipid II flippase)
LSAGAAVLNLGLNYFLILHGGMLGAAWATLLSFAAIAGASYWCSQRLLPLPLAAGRASVALVLAIGLYLVSRWWVPGSLVLTVLMKIGMLVAYPILLWKGRVFSPSEIETLSFVKESAASALGRLFGSARGRAASV